MRRQGEFGLDKNAYLYRRGLRFAHLGRDWGGQTAYDSGPLHDTGVFGGTLNYTSWSFSELIYRPQLYFGPNSKVTYTSTPIRGTGPFSISAWVFPIAAGGWDGPIVTWGDSGVAHDYFELNIDSSGYVHGDQASGSNSSTFFGAATAGQWNHLLYIHEDNSPVNGDTLYVDGVEATGGGVGSTVLDITEGGGDTLQMGQSNDSSIYQITAAVGDVLIFDQRLVQADAELLTEIDDETLRGLIIEGAIANAYDMESIR